MSISIDFLVLFAQGGSEAAFLELWSAIETNVSNQVRRMLGARRADQIDDVLQEVRIRLWKSLPKYNPLDEEGNRLVSLDGKPVPAMAWVNWLVKNTALNYLHKDRDRESLVPLYKQSPDGSEAEIVIDVIDRSADLDSHIACLEIERFIYELPHSQRAVLNLRRDGLSHDEIAAELGINAANSRKLLERAQAGLRKKLGLPAPVKQMKIVVKKEEPEAVEVAA